MKNIIKIAALQAVVFSFLAIGGVVSASEVTGSLSTGASNIAIGNSVEGVVVVSPVASPVAGTYSAKQNVVLTALGASSIHYTTNGSVPVCSTGSVYSGAIVVGSSQVIKAISCYSNNVSSSVSSFAYALTLVDGNGSNLSITASSAGEVSLPTGATGVVLTSANTLDLSVSKVSQTEASVTVGGSVVALTQNVVLQSGVDGSPVILSNSSLSNVTASIPDGTKIQASSGWDGKIAPPTSVVSSGTAPAGFTVGGTVVSIGSSDVTLVFDNAVTILLTGVTGSVGYRPSGSSSWTQITNSCSGSYASPTAPAFPGECAISNGTDTKIVTYHFTTFGALTAIPVPAPVSSGGGGGGIVSGPGSFGFNAIVPAVSPVLTTAKASAVKIQKLLGATASSFTKALSLGSKNEEVTQLQEYLTSSGLYKGPITGYFGALTKVAVVALQKANGLAQVGMVGPATRALLNKGINPTSAETVTTKSAPASISTSTSTSKLTPVQIKSITTLLQTFGADQKTIDNVNTALGGK